MGDRFYQSQKEPRKRVLKKDIIFGINVILESDIKGLDKCTVATLQELESTIFDKLSG